MKHLKIIFLRKIKEYNRKKDFSPHLVIVKREGEYFGMNIYLYKKRWRYTITKVDEIIDKDKTIDKEV